jgi:hypothetical protein
MGESGGALLLQSGLVTPEQLVGAHTALQQHGGTLSYHLVRLGLVAEDKLAEFYRHRLMVPRIKRAELERIPQAVIERVPRDMADELRLVPVEVDAEGNLTVAMSDPSNTHAVDEVGFFTGHYVMRAVALESDIEWALAKYYGILRVHGPVGLMGKKEPTQPFPRATPPPKPAASAAEAAPPSVPRAGTARARSGASQAAHLRGRTRPPASARVAMPTPADDAEPILLTKRKPSAEPILLTTHARSRAPRSKPAEPPRKPAEPPRKPTEPPRKPAEPPRARPADAPRSRSAEPPRKPTRPPPRIPGATTSTASSHATAASASSHTAQPTPFPHLAETIRALRQASSRDDVSRGLLDFLAPLYRLSVLFVAKKGALVCWDARGAAVPTALRALAIPLEIPSLLREALSARTSYRGPIGDGPANQLLASVLGGPPAEILLAPMVLHDRALGVIYADSPKTEVPDGMLDRLAFETAAAFERLLKGKPR